MVQLSAPRTLREWQTFVAGIILLYVLLLLLTSDWGPLTAIGLGIFYGTIMALTVMALVFIWRGFRDVLR